MGQNVGSGILKCHIVLDGPPTPAWQAAALARLRRSAVVDVIAISHEAPPPRSRAQALHESVDRRVFRLGPDPLAAEDVERDLTSGEEADMCDLVVWLPERPPVKKLVSGAPRVAYVRHRGSPMPIDAVVRTAIDDGACCIESDVMLESDEMSVIAQTNSGVRPFSATLTRDLILWKLADLLPRSIERYAEGNPSRVEPPSGGVASWPQAESQLRDDASSQADDRAAATRPSRVPIAAIARSYARVLATRALYRRPWAICVRRRADSPHAPWRRGDRLVAWRPGHTYADPFLFEHEGRHHLFCEEVALGSHRGVISHTELALDGTLAAAPTPVLTAPCHLSYPFVFAHGGTIYMIPETSALRRVELYRAVAFPVLWQREATLIADVHASDATLLSHGGRLWLFANVAPPNAGSLDELHVYSSRSPLGPWRPHPLNPVVSDVRCGRPAGAFQTRDGKLVRPAQDGSCRYGWAVSFREVTALDAERYEERELGRLEPAGIERARALHTYSADRAFEAIDLRERHLRVVDRFALMRRRRS